jgi:hypothetical protein
MKTKMDGQLTGQVPTVAGANNGLPGEPGKCVCSPFREDKRASFSVYRDTSGRSRFRDHANGGRGDALDFIKLARNCDAGEALRWARDFLGIAVRKLEAAASAK